MRGQPGTLDLSNPLRFSCGPQSALEEIEKRHEMTTILLVLLVLFLLGGGGWGYSRWRR
jgi:hypothetical protein